MAPVHPGRKRKADMSFRKPDFTSRIGGQRRPWRSAATRCTFLTMSLMPIPFLSPGRPDRWPSRCRLARARWRLVFAAVSALATQAFAVDGPGYAAAWGSGRLVAQAAPQDAAGFAALRTGAYDDAVRALRAQALEGNAAALTGWVTALRETGDYNGAVSAAERGVEMGVGGARALLGAALMGVGRIAEARAALEAGAREGGAGGAAARVELGILEYRYGDRDAARVIFDGFIDYYNSRSDLTAAELTAVGRAMFELSRWHYEYAHDALMALDEAVAAGLLDHSAELAIGELFLQRYDAREAAAAFGSILEENPVHAGAHFGLARVSRLEGGGDPEALLEAALETNPDLAAGRILLARLRLRNGDREAAMEEIARALEVNPADLDALGTRAAILHLSGDLDGYSAVMEEVRRLTPTPAPSLLVVSDLAADHRKYADALSFARAAAEADPGSWTAWGLIGLNQVRLGQVDEGRVNLERAFEGDPFNLWFKNTLDLLDTFGEYRIVETPHFRLVLHESEADLLEPYIVPVAERAWEEMSQRYGVTPEGPIRVEVYPRHADFSVRTVGLVGIGALGVSFGPALAIDSPAARDRGDFNWASTLWHEIAHSFHLAASDNEVPRWFSEGLAVHEQRKADPGWGHQASVGFIRALASGEMRPVSELDRGFSSPRHPGEVVQSYYQSSLVFELIEERHGFPAIVEMLGAYRDGATNEEAFSRALGVRLEDFDKDFENFLKDRFSAALASVEGEMPEMGALPGLPELQAAAATNPRNFVARMAVGQVLFAEGRLTEAAAHLEAALDLFPQYGGADGAHWFLGRIREEQGDTAVAISHYRELLRLNESHYDGRVALGELLASTGDDAGAAEVLRHLPHIHPYEIADHERIAALMESAGDLQGAVTARRGVVALRPVDLAAAQYKLARALHLTGDRAGARRAVLAALELAPNYEEALDLLLELRRRGPGR